MTRLTDEQREQFSATGFLVLRGLLHPEETRTYFAELRALLDASFGGSYDGKVSHWVPATDRHTPLAAGLIADPRFRDLATELLGRPVLGEGTDGSFYVGDTPWHHDAVHPERCEALKLTLYGDPVDGQSGALRLIPGSHRAPLHDRLTREANANANANANAQQRGLTADAPPGFVFTSQPGDAVVFDVRVWHGAFNGGCRIAGSVNYRIDPATEHEIGACKRYFARSHHHVHHRYGESIKLYPEYWRSLPHPGHQASVARMAALGVLDGEVSP